MPEPPTPPAAFVNSPDTAPAYWLRDALWHVLVSGKQTGGAMTVLEQLMPNGNGPPPHVHERLHECFYLLEGEIKYQVGDGTVMAKAGDAVSIPPGTIHAFKVVSDVARVLNIYTPGDFDQWTTNLGVPAQAQTLPPEGAAPPPTPEQDAAFALRAQQLQTQVWLTEEPDLSLPS